MLNYSLVNVNKRFTPYTYLQVKDSFDKFAYERFFFSITLFRYEIVLKTKCLILI